MTIDLNRLKTMTKEELIDIARQVNAPHHHKNAPATLIENIINKVMEQSIIHPDNKKQPDAEPKETVFLTESQLEEAFAPIKEKYKAFSTSYDHEAKCCVMKYFDGRHRHAETMSLSCSLPKFMRKANEIARGPLTLPTHRLEDWERLSTSTGKNAYTQVVLG